MATLVEVIRPCVEAHSPMGPLGARDLAPGAPGALLVSPTSVELVSGADEGAAVLPGCAPWVGTCCSPTVTGWKPARSLPMAEVPTTQTAHVSPSRGSIRGPRRQAACGGRCLRMPSRACDALLAHRAAGNAPQREASRGRGEPPRLCTCTRRGRSVGSLRVRGWRRRRARWHGWQGAV